MIIPAFRFPIPVCIFLLLLSSTGCTPAYIQEKDNSAPAYASSHNTEEVLEIVISAGAGGGQDKFTRFIIAIINEGGYHDRPVIPVNKVDAIALQVLLFEEQKENILAIGSNSFLTRPLFMRLPYDYRSTTPVCILAFRDFILWVRADAPYRTAKDFIAAARKRSIKVGGTGSRQEDEILFRLIEESSGTKPFDYVPMAGGHWAAGALADGEIEATVNQFSEIGDLYPFNVRPLCIFRDDSLLLPTRVTLPSARKAGIPVNFQDFIGFFAPPGISREHEEKLVRLFRDVSLDETWIDMSGEVGLRRTFLTGDEMMNYLADMEKLQADLFERQGWSHGWSL